MPPLVLEQHLVAKHGKRPVAAPAAQKVPSRKRPFILGICASLAAVGLGFLVLQQSGAVQLDNTSAVASSDQRNSSKTGSQGASADQEKEDQTCQDIIETASGGYVCADDVPEAERHLLDEGGSESSGELHEITIRAAMYGDCGFIMQREVLVYDGFEELVGSGRYTKGEYDESGRCIASALLEVPFRNIYSIHSETFDNGSQYLMSVTWSELEANDFIAG
jgi:hypothetical protein